jgi:hypothetical protein
MPASPAEPSTRPMPCTMASSARDAVIRGSFCRSDPAAELRGLANAALPASSSDSFSLPNASTGMNTSPLTSRVAGCPEPFSRAGMEVMVRMFGVTSSPVLPSPRVAALTSAPSRYTRSIARPSILSSHRYGPLNPLPPSFVARSAQPPRSSSVNTLSRLSSRSRCSTGVNSVDIAPCTVWVGESGVRRSGYCSSSARSSRILVS